MAAPLASLQTILDYSHTKPMIHPAFGPTMGILDFVDFWSSTSWVSDYYDPAYNAWGVDFLDGGTTAFGKTSALRVPRRRQRPPRRTFPRYRGIPRG